MSISVTPDMILRRTISGGVYDTMVDARIGNNATSLARVDLGIHFKKFSPYKDNDKFVGADGRECVFNYIGEVAPGFVAHPIGNYNGFGEKHAIPTIVPTNAPPRIKGIFHNQLSTLTNVMDVDGDRNGQTRSKTFTRSSIPNGPVDTIYTTTAPIYVVDTDKTLPRVKVNLDDDNDEVDTATSADQPPAEPEVGDLYPCTVLQGYGGPRFNHTASKAVQLDIRDPEGSLILPQDTWMWIVPGALILVHATMHVYRINRMTIYQLTANSIQVLDKGDIIPPAPAILGLPDSRPRYIGGPTEHATNGRHAIVNFANLMKGPGAAGTSSPSGSGKQRPKRVLDTTEPSANDDIFVSVPDDVEMSSVEEKQNKAAGKKARRGSVLSMCL
ncbi:hypothetical protein F5878DRAFT_657064 [Lentinula raphanica]|uniref:Uncharacterized protein n=1 Tax=Lentinula raphanica TaxID=153919 RepID=A0AA38PID4_9AGAR|nr:hypothetical protein F5878DRAFT_657064 [Lentinula raphanica]